MVAETDPALPAGVEPWLFQGRRFAGLPSARFRLGFGYVTDHRIPDEPRAALYVTFEIQLALDDMKGLSILAAAPLVLAGCAHWSEELHGPVELGASPLRVAPVSEGLFNCVELCIEGTQPFRASIDGPHVAVLYRDGSIKHRRFEKVYINTPLACSLLGEELTDKAVEVQVTSEPPVKANRIYWYWHFEH